MRFSKKNNFPTGIGLVPFQRLTVRKSLYLYRPSHHVFEAPVRLIHFFEFRNSDDSDKPWCRKEQRIKQTPACLSQSHTNSSTQPLNSTCDHHSLASQTVQLLSSPQAYTTITALVVGLLSAGNNFLLYTIIYHHLIRGYCSPLPASTTLHSVSSLQLQAFLNSSTIVVNSYLSPKATVNFLINAAGLRPAIIRTPSYYSTTQTAIFIISFLAIKHLRE